MAAANKAVRARARRVAADASEKVGRGTSGVLRHALLRALFRGETRRDALVACALNEFAGGALAGDDAPREQRREAEVMVRASCCTLLWREAHTAKRPMWSQSGDTYALTTEGEAAAAAADENSHGPDGEPAGDGQPTRDSAVVAASEGSTGGDVCASPVEQKAAASPAAEWGSTAGLIEDDQWEVERLVSRRLGRRRRVEYLVRWAGWAAQYDSWEPAKHIDQRLVEEFERREAEAAIIATAMETEPRLVSVELLSEQREGDASSVIVVRLRVSVTVR